MTSIKITLLLSVLNELFTFGSSANILGAFPIPSKSHDILGSVLFKHLARSGHNVTYISAFPHENLKNFHHIYMKEADEYREEHVKILQGSSGGFQLLQLSNHLSKFGKIFFEDEGIKSLLNSNTEFDLFINFMGVDASIALAHRFNTPVIVFAAIGGFPLHDKLTGNPAPYSYVPTFMIPCSDEMNIFERTMNTVVSYIVSSILEFISHTTANNHINKYLPNYPTMKEIMRRVDLILVNSHISTESPRPYVPNIIQIGGYHLQEPEPLSEDLKKVLDDAKEGFVYFSFGTNVKVKEVSPAVLDVFKKTLGKLPMKIIMKYEDNTIPDQPNNFYVRKWFPQPSVLAHPNAKLFISHGGYGGCTESLFYGVPMVCVPFFGDQPKNCADAEHNGYSITVKLDEMTEETFSTALQKVLYDQKFKEAVKFKSELYRDQPINPMDKAVYWIEHVIKHKGAKHLRVKGADLPWYQ